jgi:HK97 gp10 family phage protein
MSGYVRFDQAALEKLFSSPDGPVGKELARRSIRVERAAKRACPVDTGRLRSSIARETGRDERGLVARIGTDVDYAAYVEFGTGRMSARPYLRPALDAAR